ncbi:MAG: four helix bundle protein [Anaerolineae bacterium]
MNFADWCETVPSEIRDDVLWKVKAYQLALFAADIAWPDVTKLMGDLRTWALSDQLYRAVGSVSANIGEGYSRRSGRDRARFYEYALGSAREARDWYYKARHLLDPAVVDHRLRLFTQIIRLLLTIIPRQRRTQFSDSQIKEEQPPYDARPFDPLEDAPLS